MLYLLKQAFEGFELLIVIAITIVMAIFIIVIIDIVYISIVLLLLLLFSLPVYLMELVKHIVCLIALFTTILSITARLYLLTQLIIDTTTTRMIDTIHTRQ